MAPRTVDPALPSSSREALYRLGMEDRLPNGSMSPHSINDTNMTEGGNGTLLSAFSETLYKLMCFNDICGASFHNGKEGFEARNEATSRTVIGGPLRVHIEHCSPSSKRNSWNDGAANGRLRPSTPSAVATARTPVPARPPLPVASSDDDASTSGTSFRDIMADAYNEGIFCCMPHDDKYKNKYLDRSWSKTHSRSIDSMLSEFSDQERYYARRWNGHLPLVPMKASEKAVEAKLMRLKKARVARGSVPSADPPPDVGMNIDF